MKKLEYFDDGYVVDPQDEMSKRYEVSYIRAEYGNDREDLLGVSRIMDIDIECQEGTPPYLQWAAKRELFNALADKEYFDEDPDFEKKAARDLSMHTGVPKDKIDVVFG